MTNTPHEDRESYRIIGFDQLSEGTLLIPHYRRVGTSSNNALFAVPRRSGDPRSEIAGFGDVHQQHVTTGFPAPAAGTVRIGDPMQHAFPVGSDVYVGTVDNLLVALGPIMSDIAADRPLTLLSVFGSDDGPTRSKLLSQAISLIDKRLVDKAGTAWIMRDFLPRQVRILINRSLDTIGQRSTGLINRSDIRCKLTPKGLSIVLPVGGGDFIANHGEGLQSSLQALARDVNLAIGLPFQDLSISWIVDSARPASSVDVAESVRHVLVLPVGPISHRLAKIICNNTRQGRFVATSRAVANRLETHDTPENLDPHRYAGAIVLVDNHSANTEIRGEVEPVLDLLRDIDGPVILAPTLPEATTSRLLDGTAPSIEHLSGWDAVLDTSIVRSPNWWGDASSVRWRMRELLEATASAMEVGLLSSAQTARLSSARYPVKRPILCIAVHSSKDRPKYQSEAVDLIISERFDLSKSDRHDRFEQWKSVEIHNRRGRKLASPRVLSISMTGRDPNFSELAYSAFRLSAERLSRDVLRSLDVERDASVAVQGTFRAQETARLSVMGVNDTVNIRVTEARPPWSLIRAEAERGVSCVRYSDRAGMDRIVSHLSKTWRGPTLPTDFVKPEPRSAPSRRAFALTTRSGPTATMAIEDFRSWANDFSDHPFAQQPRFLAKRNRSKQGRQRVTLLHSDVFDPSLSHLNGTKLLHRYLLLAHSPDDARYRTATLANSERLAPPGLQRFAIPSGERRPRPFSVSDGVVLPRGWFQIYGDPSLLEILLSRVFRVWWEAFAMPYGKPPGQLRSMQPLNRFPFPSVLYVPQNRVEGVPINWLERAVMTSSNRFAGTNDFPTLHLTAEALLSGDPMDPSRHERILNGQAGVDFDAVAMARMDLPAEVDDVVLFEMLCERAELKWPRQTTVQRS